jgi:hypothetical protein
VNKPNGSHKKSSQGKAPNDSPPPPRQPGINSNEDDYEPGGADKRKKQINYTDKPTHWGPPLEAICAVLLVFITGAYTFFAGHQWGEMRRTNNLTKQAMHISSRAWVGIESVTPISLDRDDNGVMLTVNFTLKNYGHSAAEHVRIFPELHILGAVSGAGGKCGDSNAGVYVGDVILPEQKRELPWGPYITNAEIESEMRKINPAIGRNIPGLIIQGCLEYIDDPTETVSHHTPFSYWITRPVGRGFIPIETKHLSSGDLVVESNPEYPGPTD